MSSPTNENLSAATLEERYDHACKVVLANKVFLARILKGCVEEYKDCTYEEIIDCIEGMPEIGESNVRPDSQSKIHGQNTEDASISENTIYYDVKFDAAIPGSDEEMRLIINIEAQKKYNPGYPLIKRALYYASRLISSQYGREFEHSHYEKLKKVYSIWICMDSPKKRMNSVTEYEICERNMVGAVREKKENYDLVKVIMICLGKVDKDTGEVLGCDDKMLRFLNILLAVGLSYGKRKNILENEFEIDLTGEPDKEMNEMCNLSSGIREEGRAEGLAQGLSEGLFKGRAEGLSEGLTKGLAQGEYNQRLSSLTNMVKNHGIDFDFAADLLGIPEAERDRYRKLI